MRSASERAELEGANVNQAVWKEPQELHKVGSWVIGRAGGRVREGQAEKLFGKQFPLEPPRVAAGQSRCANSSSGSGRAIGWELGGGRLRAAEVPQAPCLCMGASALRGASLLPSQWPPLIGMLPSPAESGRLPPLPAWPGPPEAGCSGRAGGAGCGGAGHAAGRRRHACPGGTGGGPHRLLWRGVCVCEGGGAMHCDGKRIGGKKKRHRTHPWGPAELPAALLAKIAHAPWAAWGLLLFARPPARWGRPREGRQEGVALVSVCMH